VEEEEEEEGLVISLCEYSLRVIQSEIRFLIPLLYKNSDG
jgi:hypothetical protein